MPKYNKHKNNKPFNNCLTYKYKLIVYPMKWQQTLSLRQSQQFFESQCKVCYHSFDNNQHYPMLICEAHHLLCQHCFNNIKKDKKQIACPFCKRNTKVSRVQRFKYILTANHLYATLKGQYLQLKGLYKRETRQLQRHLGLQDEQMQGMSFTQINSQITSLKLHLNETLKQYNIKLSQTNKNEKRVEQLSNQLDIYKFKLRIFENKCDLKQEQVEKLQLAQRQNQEMISTLYQEAQCLKRLNLTQAHSIEQLNNENTTLLRKNECMKEQLRKDQQIKPTIEFIRSEIRQYLFKDSMKQESGVAGYESDKENQPFSLKQ